MKARIVRQGQPLHHKMHGVTEHEYQQAKHEQAPSGTQLSAVMKDLTQAHGAPAPQYAGRGTAGSLVIYTQSGGCVFRSVEDDCLQIKFRTTQLYSRYV